MGATPIGHKEIMSLPSLFCNQILNNLETIFIKRFAVDQNKEYTHTSYYNCTNLCTVLLKRYYATMYWEI